MNAEAVVEGPLRLLTPEKVFIVKMLKMDSMQIGVQKCSHASKLLKGLSLRKIVCECIHFDPTDLRPCFYSLDFWCQFPNSFTILVGWFCAMRLFTLFII